MASNAAIRRRMLTAPTARPKQADLEALADVTYGLDPAGYVDSLAATNAPKVFEWQAQVLRDPSRRICINGARQAGKSTIIAGKAAHMARFNPNSLSVILAPSLAQASETFKKMQSFIKNDRSYPKFIKNNQSEMEFANGSRILIIVATDVGARGFSKPDLVIFDEASRIGDDIFYAVRPMITDNPYACIVEISTPNGDKGFFRDHFNSRRWTRYQVRTAFDVVFNSMGMPDLVPTTYRPVDPDVHFFISPRHTDYQDQYSALTGEKDDDDGGMSVRKFRQEFCTEFVSAEDQVFETELIKRMFNAKSQEKNLQDLPEVASMITGEAEPDPLFTGEYQADIEWRIGG